MPAAVVEIDDVTKTFDNLVAVSDVSLRVEQGQTLGLIGPNGAGKTTLLRLISSLAKPDSGDIRIHGTSVRKSPRTVRMQLGFMPAEFGSPRNLNIGEYLDYFGCMYGIPKTERQRRIVDVSTLTDLNGREEVMVKGLSTGNKQRLLLAKTLLHDPELLVLDEPASGLDPRARTELRAIVRELASMGKTIIISSHILPDIEEINSTLTAAGDRHGPETVEEEEQAAESRRGFRFGFFTVFLTMAVLMAIYLFAPQIAAAVPAFSPALTGLVGSPRTRQPHRSVPPEIDERCRSAATAS